MRINENIPVGSITGSDLAQRLAHIRQLERVLGRPMPTTIEANVRAWESRELPR